MRSFHALALFSLPFIGRVICEETPTTPTQQDHAAVKKIQQYYSSPNEAFQDLLNALPEESLHAALDSLTHFRAGIFESDRHGVERIHQENPPLATKLIVAAVQDLKKRQTPSNGTTTRAPDKPSDSPKPAPSPPSSAVVVPVQVTTTNSQGKTTVTSINVYSEPTASVTVPVTVTNSKGQTVTETKTKPAVVHSTTNAAGSVVLTTAAVDFAPSKGQVVSTTNAEGSAFVTTYTPDAVKVSSVVFQTTTGEDGQPTVVTKVTYVDPVTATGSEAPSKTSNEKPGLQSAAAGRVRAADIAMMGGAWAGIFAFLA
jgi:hypothetical protein